MATITTTYQGEMAFEAVLGRHRLLIDVPAAIGGTGRGPTPPELFGASLGSCVAAFVASYCQRAGLDSRDFTVEVSYEKAAEPTRLVGLKVTIRLPHAVCGDRQEAIARVARHCPVHETIATLADVQIQIVDLARNTTGPRLQAVVAAEARLSRTTDDTLRLIASAAVWDGAPSCLAWVDNHFSPLL